MYILEGLFAIRQLALTRPAKPWGMLITASMLLALGSAAHAQSTIYRCTKDGRVTLTDQPCDGKPGETALRSAAPGNTIQAPRNGGPPDSPTGTWHAPLIAELTVAGKPAAINPPVGALTFQISPAGLVSGSFQNGTCLMAGRVTGDYSRGDRALDVTVTRCNPAQLNMRFSGDIRIGAVGEPAHLALSGLSGFTQGKNENTASLKAELIRDPMKPH